MVCHSMARRQSGICSQTLSLEILSGRLPDAVHARRFSRSTCVCSWRRIFYVRHPDVPAGSLDLTNTELEFVWPNAGSFRLLVSALCWEGCHANVSESFRQGNDDPRNHRT